MFSLLQGLIRYFFRTVEYYVLIVGLDNAGKTTLLEQMKKIFSGGPGLDPSQIPPTVGLNIGRMATDGDRLVFWDLGGQSGLRVIWEKYYSESQAVIFVVDSTDEARLEEARNALGSILRHRDLHGVPVLVLANKQDCEGALSQEEMTAALGIGPDSPAPPGRAVLCEPASALTGYVVSPAVWNMKPMAGSLSLALTVFVCFRFVVGMYTVQRRSSARHRLAARAAQGQSATCVA